MKPPPRTRTKPHRHLQPQPVPQRRGKVACKWQRGEQRKLLNALRALCKLVGGNGDIDYAFLRKQVPTRSIEEIQAVVDSLKHKVTSGASFQLKKQRWEDEKVRKPIEAWTHMASAVAGTLEEPISNAFSQMLIVSSTEPRTLRNCDPPQIDRPPLVEDRPLGRTVPLRPMPCVPVQGELPGTNTAHPPLLLKTPAPTTTGPTARAPAPPEVVRVPQPSTTAGDSPPTTCSSPATASEQHPPIASTVKSTSSRATSLNPPPSTAPPSAASGCPSAQRPLSAPAAGFHARFGRTSKHATGDSPRNFGVKCIVDFERIYHYLSVIHKPDEECHLTPMESAIILDLLMSLPDELSLLDCSKLRKHLIQVYQCLSSPADSKMAREMFGELKAGPTEAPSGGGSQQDAAGTVNSDEVVDNGAQGLNADGAESQSAGSNKTCSQPVKADLMGLNPPLNPFLVPLKLLMRSENVN